MRLLLDRLDEVGLRDLDQPSVRLGPHGRAPAVVQQEGHLAHEDVVRRHRGDDLAVDQDFVGSLCDVVEERPGLALVENDVSWSDVLRLDFLEQGRRYGDEVPLVG